MTNRETALKIRRAHRYLGLFLGIQFLLWTISGLYFSWTDIDEIHGDHFKKIPPEKTSFTNLLQVSGEIESLELLEIVSKPFYWINDSKLFNALTGELKEKVSQDEALLVAARYVKSDIKVSAIKQIDSVGPHHEYRGRPLLAYEISYNSSENIKSFVALNNGAFQTVRHRNWRWFDFFMDDPYYELSGA